MVFPIQYNDMYVGNSLRDSKEENADVKVPGGHSWIALSNRLGGELIHARAHMGRERYRGTPR